MFSTIATQLESLPAELSAAEAIEAIIMDALNEDGFELYSASTLVLLGNRARADAASPPAEETVREIAEPLAASVRDRTPGATPFDAEVLLNTYGIAGLPRSRRTSHYPSPATPMRGGPWCAGHSRCCATCASRV